jgi:hypothetical protein
MCFGPSVNPAAGAAYGGAAGMLGDAGGSGGWNAPQGAPQITQPSWSGGNPFGFGGGFGSSPWLGFLMNYLSSFGGPQQPQGAGVAQAATGTATQPIQPAAASPLPASPVSAPQGAALAIGSDPAAALPPTTGTVQPPPATSIALPTFATPRGPAMAAPSRDPFGSPSAPAIPAAGPGANMPTGALPSALTGLGGAWAHLLGT